MRSDYNGPPCLLANNVNSDQIIQEGIFNFLFLSREFWKIIKPSTFSFQALKLQQLDVFHYWVWFFICRFSLWDKISYARLEQFLLRICYLPWRRKWNICPNFEVSYLWWSGKRHFFSPKEAIKRIIFSLLHWNYNSFGSIMSEETSASPPEEVYKGGLLS